MALNENQHTKMHLVTETMNATGMTRTAATKAVDAVFDSIFGALDEGKSVRINNVGTLYTKDIPERQQRNPATGETFMAPAHRKVALKVSKAGTKALNGE